MAMPVPATATRITLPNQKTVVVICIMSAEISLHEVASGITAAVAARRSDAALNKIINGLSGPLGQVLQIKPKITRLQVALVVILQHLSENNRLNFLLRDSDAAVVLQRINGACLSLTMTLQGIAFVTTDRDDIHVRIAEFENLVERREHAIYQIPNFKIWGEKIAIMSLMWGLYVVDTHHSFFSFSLARRTNMDQIVIPGISDNETELQRARRQGNWMMVDFEPREPPPYDGSLARPRPYECHPAG